MAESAHGGLCLGLLVRAPLQYSGCPGRGCLSGLGKAGVNSAALNRAKSYSRIQAF